MTCELWAEVFRRKLGCVMAEDKLVSELEFWEFWYKCGMLVDGGWFKPSCFPVTVKLLLEQSRKSSSRSSTFANSDFEFLSFFSSCRICINNRNIQIDLIISIFIKYLHMKLIQKPQLRSTLFWRWMDFLVILFPGLEILNAQGIHCKNIVWTHLGIGSLEASLWW